MSVAMVQLRLYIAGDAHNSLAAVANLKTICRRLLAGRCEIEHVDVLQEPDRALADGIFMTPMLVKLSPGPIRKVVGSLSDGEVVMQSLGLTAFLA